MTAPYVRRLATCLAVLLGVAACGPVTTGDSAGGRIDVLASTDVWASVVRAIGGSHVHVTTVVDGSSADPHDYRATALDASRVSEAELVVYNGGGYDPYMPQLLQAVGAPGHRSISAVRAAGHAGDNEHVFYDPQSLRRVASALRQVLDRLRPGAGPDFRANLAGFERRVADVEQRMNRIAAEHAGAAVLATSPLSHYLLTATRLHNVTPSAFTEAVEHGNGIPVLVQHHVEQLLTNGEVVVMLRNVQLAGPVVDGLAERAGREGIPVVGVSETLPDGSGGALARLRSVTAALAGALQKPA